MKGRRVLERHRHGCRRSKKDQVGFVIEINRALDKFLASRGLGPPRGYGLSGFGSRILVPKKEQEEQEEKT